MRCREMRQDMGWILIGSSIVVFLSAVVYLQYVSFQLFSYCEGPTSSSSSSFRFLVVGDSHLLGTRRSDFDRNWVDWQVKRSLEFAIQKHDPTDLIFLGDLFDEGKRYDAETYRKERVRFVSTILRSTHENGVRIHTIAGNHDIGNHYQLRKAKIETFENTIGPTNYYDRICVDEKRCVSLLGVNTMALEGTPFDRDVKQNTVLFLNQIEAKREERKNDPLVLLTHYPLFRVNDAECGPERSIEHGHVTYVHPNTKLKEKSYVLSESTSNMLLDRFEPSLVLSAHTHAVCRHRRKSMNGVLELTTSAFGWRMRPDPGYLFVTFESDPSRLDTALYCKLPHERVSIAISITLCVISGFLVSLGLVFNLFCRGAEYREKDK